MKEYSLELNGKSLSLKIDNIAAQTNASIWAQYGETVVLATVTQSATERDGIDYFPLMVDYDERFYAVGKILGSRFVRREGRPTDEAVLTSRMIDRALRPMFDKNERRDVQVVITVLSFDKENDPDIISLIAASTALMISDINFNGPVGAVRLVKNKEGKLIVNPSYTEREDGLFDLTLAGKNNTVNMIESGAKEAPEEEIEKAFDEGAEILQKICDWQRKITNDVGKEKIPTPIIEEDVELKTAVKRIIGDKLEKLIFAPENINHKPAISDLMKQMIDEIKEQFGAEKIKEAIQFFYKIQDNLIKENILKNDRRSDGRKLDELRPISFTTGLLPRTHGTGLFSRGLTRALTVVTLGAPSDEKLVEGMEVSEKKRYMHNYNFPPFSVGEARSARFLSRREIGHGALAEKAMVPVLPSADNFPYTIRTVTEILSSNGSTSMASTCGSTLALMDAGVPIVRPVAGISIGLVYESDDNYKLLTDIAGIEDGSGHMDFKVAGTERGITAIQLDIKLEGLSVKILKETLARARTTRLFILEEMKKVIAMPRKNLSKFAPRVIIVKIDPDKIGMVIGSGGKTINEIIDTTGVAIDIEEDGRVFITSENEEAGLKAKEIVENLVREFEVGEVVRGKVVKILDFGAFVELAPGKDGLIHVSQLSDTFVKNVSDIVKEGQIVEVKVVEIDQQGKIKLKLLKTEIE